MATRSEQFHAAEQRRRSKRASKKAAAHEVKKARIKRKEHAHENLHAAKKATVALEPRSAKGRASRKSTRASANRGKPDVTVSELRAEWTQMTPDVRYRNQK